MAGEIPKWLKGLVSKTGRGESLRGFKSLFLRHRKSIRTIWISCSNLTLINIPDNITSIGRHAFLDCSSLKSIIIPDSVQYIGGGAFENCSSLTIYCEDTSEPLNWRSGWADPDCEVLWGDEWEYKKV